MYNFKDIEDKWIKYWDEHETYKTDVTDFSKPKFYALSMFPYPSGEGLHVGHPEGYTANDIMARMKRMQGYNVLHPIGFDSFGLPAEQYAIKTGNHPEEFTKRNINNFKRQIKSLGLSYDWSRTIETHDPDYYKWTQMFFNLMYKQGLVEYQDTTVNWCEGLGTVLANDEIIDGKSERGGFPVIKKTMKQWIVKTTKYAEKLLNQLDDLDWPNSTKEMQRNWIGRSVGAYVNFKIDKSDLSFKVFTTRCDTLFGATFCVLSPEIEIIPSITSIEQKKAVDKYINESAKKSDLERTDLNKEKTGVFTGFYAINPVNNKKLPIFIADYVLANYGTGALMAVPAHDQRDYDFAKKFNLEIIPVLEGGDITLSAYEGDGKHINSGFINDLNKEDATKKMISWLQENKVGEKTTNYRLRDWIFARQRYWGEPVPVIFMENGDIRLEENLPLKLPKLSDYKAENGKAPLDKATEWKNVSVNGIKGVRETSTMPGSAASSWYFLRYIDPHNDKTFADKKLIDHWLPVDLYIGGSEHAVGHLIYSRFWNNFLFDNNLVGLAEPFKKLIHQGMILGTDNEKMSKSKGNVVNPDDIIKEFGADTIRLYEMFMGPIQDVKPWNTQNIEGSKRFLERVYRLYAEFDKIKNEDNKNLEQIYNETVKKVTEDFENLAFNTAISQMMIFINAVYKEEVFPKFYAENFLKLFNPICPFITEELWATCFNYTETIDKAKWPTFDENKIIKQNVTIAIQINGKMKDTIEIPYNSDDEFVKNKVINVPKIKTALEGILIKKFIIIKNKIVNILI